MTKGTRTLYSSSTAVVPYRTSTMLCYQGTSTAYEYLRIAQENKKTNIEIGSQGGVRWYLYLLRHFRVQLPGRAITRIYRVVVNEWIPQQIRGPWDVGPLTSCVWDGADLVQWNAIMIAPLVCDAGQATLLVKLIFVLLATLSVCSCCCCCLRSC